MPSQKSRFAEKLYMYFEHFRADVVIDVVESGPYSLPGAAAASEPTTLRMKYDASGADGADAAVMTSWPDNDVAAHHQYHSSSDAAAAVASGGSSHVTVMVESDFDDDDDSLDGRGRSSSCSSIDSAEHIHHILTTCDKCTERQDWAVPFNLPLAVMEGACALPLWHQSLLRLTATSTINFGPTRLCV